MSSLTAAGKLRKSRLADPIQCSGFSEAAKTRRIANYPSFGIIRASPPDDIDGLEDGAKRRDQRSLVLQVPEVQLLIAEPDTSEGVFNGCQVLRPAECRTVTSACSRAHSCKYAAACGVGIGALIPNSVPGLCVTE
jgi:hypothetical protein